MRYHQCIAASLFLYYMWQGDGFRNSLFSREIDVVDFTNFPQTIVFLIFSFWSNTFEMVYRDWLCTKNANLSTIISKNIIAKLFHFLQWNWDVQKITTITVCSKIMIDYLSHSSTFFKKIHKIFQQRMLSCIATWFMVRNPAIILNCFTFFSSQQVYGN